MLNRSRIAINVNSFIRAQISPQSTGAAGPRGRTEVIRRRPTQLSAADVEHGPRRTAPCPNGDVTTRSQEGRWAPWRQPDKPTANCLVAHAETRLELTS